MGTLGRSRRRAKGFDETRPSDNPLVSAVGDLRPSRPEDLNV
jgi:hypothetical protein